MTRKEGSMRLFSRDHHVGRADLPGEHPIGDAGQIIGFFLTTLSLICLVLLGGLFLFYNFIAAFEERLLEAKFGEEYGEYKRKTPRWLLWF